MIDNSLAILLLSLLLIVIVSFSFDDNSASDCARDMEYHLTPFQRQILLDKTHTPSFDELEEHCIENKTSFAQIIEYTENLPKFRLE
jgi:hypothetical protein